MGSIPTSGFLSEKNFYILYLFLVEKMLKEKIFAWLALARPPFHTVGVLPFLLGTILAWQLEGVFRLDIFLWGTFGVILVLFTTYFAGEYWDYDENTIAMKLHKSRFAGGSRVLQKGLLSPKVALWSSIIFLIIAAIMGLILQFIYKTGILTIPFGFIGLLGGFFYSTHPIRWVRTGFGELWIAFCFGWLTVAVGYYLQTGTISPIIHWIAIPIGLTIYNVILLNEYPDYIADKKTEKNNIVVRMGRERAIYLYIIIAFSSWIAMIFTLRQGVSLNMLWLYIPVLLISIMIVIFLTRGQWQNQQILEKLCGANILVNLGTTASFIIAFLS